MITNDIYKRLFVESCFLIIGLGVALPNNKMLGALRQFAIVEVILNLAFFSFGGLAVINDAMNSTEIAGTSGYYFALDTISTGAVNFSVIVKSIIAIVPAGVLIAGLVGVYLSDSPDEMQSAVIEALVGLGLLIVYALILHYLPI